ncbi:hypothetical protein ASC59_02010 [Leifsonia sp. Root1293]|nr:hypothetical protein ASC59_02010 [Leifsonia sp. Root1293]KRA10935.1 hypothetical protein ASD61_02010 [Leifsonia sp. Root60]
MLEVLDAFFRILCNYCRSTLSAKPVLEESHFVRTRMIDLRAADVGIYVEVGAQTAPASDR